MDKDKTVTPEQIAELVTELGDPLKFTWEMRGRAADAINQLTEQVAEYKTAAEWWKDSQNKLGQGIEEQKHKINQLTEQVADYKERWEQTGCSRHYAMEVAISLNGDHLKTIADMQAKIDAYESFLFTRSHMCGGRDCIGVYLEPTGSLPRCDDCTKLAELKGEK